MIVQRTALLDLIWSLTGLLKTSVIWLRDPTPMVSPTDAMIVKVSAKSYAGAGQDETRYTLYGTGSSAVYQQNVSGNRRVVLTIRCEAFDYNIDPKEMLDQIRLGLQLDSSADTLNGIALAYSHTAAEISAEYRVNTRDVRMAQVDIMLNAVNAYNFPNNSIGSGWIDYVNDTSDVVPGIIGNPVYGTLSIGIVAAAAGSPYLSVVFEVDSLSSFTAKGQVS